MSTTTVAPVTVRRWWRTLINHWPVHFDGTDLPCCPVCRRRKCRPWAEAYAELLAHDLYHLGPPEDIDQPNHQEQLTAPTA